jgi:L-aminopeptidase/D-esterase-like protein
MIAGIRVGHWTDLDAATGCTVVLCEQGAVAGVDVRGSAPGTRETDLLRPGSLVGRVHAVLLTGGSAFGLDAAGGVMRFLEERGVGVSTPAGPVPIVAAAVLYDLSIGRADVRPDAEAGYTACMAAGWPPAEGCVGAGAGATVAKMAGPAGAVKSGIGVATCRLPNEIEVIAVVAVNAVGDVYEPDTGQPLALSRASAGVWRPFPGTNTSIGVVATNAVLDSGEVHRLARQAHDGLARAIRPAHTLYDGDTLFALSIPEAHGDPLLLGQAAAEMVARAVVRAVRSATSLHGVPAAR